MDGKVSMPIDETKIHRSSHKSENGKRTKVQKFSIDDGNGLANKDEAKVPPFDDKDAKAPSFTEFVCESTFHGVKYIFEKGSIARRYGNRMTNNIFFFWIALLSLKCNFENCFFQNLMVFVCFHCYCRIFISSDHTRL